MKKRINIALSEELIEQIDARAAAQYITRSAYISTALKAKMQSDDTLLILPELAAQVKAAIELKSVVDSEKKTNTEGV